MKVKQVAHIRKTYHIGKKSGGHQTLWNGVTNIGQERTQRLTSVNIGGYARL